MFREITSSMEERLELIKGSMSKEIALRELQECKSLDDYYYYANRVKNGIISQMQLYVLENYSKVPIEVWNKRSFTIMPHTGKKEMRFGKEDIFKSRWRIESMKKREKERYDKSIKINSIEFTLDFSDGDFSVKFNDSAWAFLEDDEILTYYYAIKRYLKDENV